VSRVLATDLENDAAVLQRSALAHRPTEVLYVWRSARLSSGGCRSCARQPGNSSDHETLRIVSEAFLMLAESRPQVRAPMSRQRSW
jgi:hypothetical protein